MSRLPSRLNISLKDFPEESSTHNGCQVNLYGETSMCNQLALITHYLHNAETVTAQERSDAMIAISDFIASKKISQTNPATDFVNMVMEAPAQYHLFYDFFNVPFPNPRKADRTLIDLFAGIGGIRLPFQELGYKCVFSSEWDKHAQQTYLANFGEMPFGDISLESTKSHIPKTFDLLLAGFPCQAFSIMGKMKGFADTRGTMFFEVATVLDRHKPQAILLENVKQLTSHDGGKTFATILDALKQLGYHVKWKVLNALDFGVPQKRERVIIVGFRDKAKYDAFDFDFEKKAYNLENILERDEDVEPSLFASEVILQKRLARTKDKHVFYPSVWHENKAGNISILDYACALRTGASYNYLLINGKRRPSSRELLRFQGFPDSYRITVPHSEIRRQTGNSVAVPMIREIAKKIDFVLSHI